MLDAETDKLDKTKENIMDNITTIEIFLILIRPHNLGGIGNYLIKNR